MMADQIDHKLEGPEATTAFGHSLARLLRTGDMITLSGDLGAGKSTLARGLISQCLSDHGLPIDDIPSPTFTIVQSYPWPGEHDQGREIWHIDLWRIDDPEELIELGFEEALGRHVMVVEWPDRLQGLLPQDVLSLNLAVENDGARHLTSGDLAETWRDRLRPLGLG
ncbi:MAG: tRNA (adenosine(37)-N6)-threonylcarbamoyltransferase complex ATPase subunit type 1 TsaE [Alphaproteobacteria bacterium]|nr:tRNA (adenosine(37)-N6)-threonylcarbamoyltransferase complex ATPase subunit type 1 TsaE [Alphaproteobacteria bacterium]